MQTFVNAITQSFKWNQEGGCWSFKFGQYGEYYELTLEPLLFDEQHYIGLYKITNDIPELILEAKVPVKPGK